METLNAKMQYIDIKSEIRLYGMAKSVTVDDGGKLDLHGMVAGDIVVRSGGMALIHGMVLGRLVCEKGSIVDVWGMVGQGVSGSATIHADAMISPK